MKAIVFHPASVVNILGIRSLAGLIAYPQFNPKDAPIATTKKPTATGNNASLGAELRLSVSEKMVPTRIDVART